MIDTNPTWERWVGNSRQYAQRNILEQLGLSNDRKSALAVHCWDEYDHMNFKDGTIIYRENNEKRRRSCYY